MIKARNIISDKGNPITNQIIIEDYKNKADIFQSYNSIIAIRGFGKNGRVKVVLDEYYWNYSRTTSKYRNIFLDETTEETKKKIKDGIYKLANLNK